MATKVSTPMLQPETQFGLVPPGAVMSFAMSAAPMGWLPCDGAAINRTTYAPLFSAIGYTHGGSENTFNVPDLRGEFIRGWSAGRDVDTGRTFGSSQIDTFKTHNHTIRAGSTPTGGGVARIADAIHTGNNGYTTNSNSDSGGTETRPRNIALLYCIKF